VLLILVGCYGTTGFELLELSEELQGVPDPATTVGGGGDHWEVYFTDPQSTADADGLRGTVAEKLIGYVDTAERTIHVAAFEFDLIPVAEAMVAARQRGVDVRLITDDEYGIEADESEGIELFNMLGRAGIPVREDGRSALMHNKFWIFDDQTVWTGSANPTANDSLRNNNNVLVLESPRVAAIYEREFEEMWHGDFGPGSPSGLERQDVTIEGMPVQVLFGPEDDVIPHLVRLVEGARHSIRFMAYSFTHDELGDAVSARARDGIDVAGIVETRGSKTEHSEMTKLHCAGVYVRQDGNPRAFHHKVLMIDDQTVVTGSLNFSHSADESNDENVVILRNTDVADRYQREFDRRWTEASEPDIRCR
jgi:phosphatidylserine/phosphatidylglycerophosphate/cardiolipin synthase-like enzyme